MNIAEILTATRELTVTGMAILGVVALARGWVITRGHHDELMRVLLDRIANQAEVIRRLKNGDNP